MSGDSHATTVVMIKRDDLKSETHSGSHGTRFGQNCGFTPFNGNTCEPIESNLISEISLLFLNVFLKKNKKKTVMETQLEIVHVFPLCAGGLCAVGPSGGE